MKQSIKKPKKYDKAAHGRKMARAIVGQPKPKVVIPSKKDKAQKRQPKHKKPITPEGISLSSNVLLFGNPDLGNLL